LAVTRLCIGQMEEFLRVAGIEPTGMDSLIAFYPMCFINCLLIIELNRFASC
jgi:hypothetical protein